MTQVASNAHRVEIVAANALSALAASLGVGTWGALSGVANQTAILGSQPGSSGRLIGYSNKAAYNAFNASIEFISADHLGAQANWKQHVRYTLSTNAWSQIQGQGAIPGIGHGYDHTVVNPFNGDLYHTNYSGFSGSVPLYRKLFGGGTFSLVTNISMDDQVSHGAAWWTGAFTGASPGAHGFLLVYDGFSGHLRGYDPLAASVIYSNNSGAPGGGLTSYHTVCVYSTVKNVAVYGGGSNDGSRLWRLNSDGTVTPMPNVPNGKSVGVTQGNFVVDPTSGNFLLLSAGQLWELNPSVGGSWTQQTGARAPPSGIGTPSPEPGAVISCEMPSHGVVAYITQTSAGGGNAFHLYKHS